MRNFTEIDVVFIGVMAAVLVLIASSCASSKVLVKNCEKMGNFLYECEEVE